VVFRHHLQDGARRHRLKAPGWRYRSGRSPVRLKFRNPRRSLPKRSTGRTFCRCMNIPARYCTGYLGDIGVPPDPAPMDFSAWFEAFVGGRWHTFDARHNIPRIGRVLIARGRDAADVAISTTFGQTSLKSFVVTTREVDEDALSSFAAPLMVSTGQLSRVRPIQMGSVRAATAVCSLPPCGGALGSCPRCIRQLLPPPPTPPRKGVSSNTVQKKFARFQ
jgi:Transglutaminase-like superfamily